MMRSFFISARSEIILDHLSILHHKPDTLEFGYVGYGVARYRNQISEFSRLDGAGPSNSGKGCDYFFRTVTCATEPGPGEKAGGL